MSRWLVYRGVRIERREDHWFLCAAEGMGKWVALHASAALGEVLDWIDAVIWLYGERPLAA